jgi:hypothetical protein
VAIPSEPWEWPEVVVRDTKSHPGLGTEASPIVIGDESVPLGSAFNPIVIDVDEDWCHGEAGQRDSDADTEIMTTPEFWENLIEESYPNPASGGADIEPTSIPARTRPRTCHDPGLQYFSKLVSDCAQLDERARILAESILGGAENCSSRGIVTCGHSATGKRGKSQMMNPCNCSTNEY